MADRLSKLVRRITHSRLASASVITSGLIVVAGGGGFARAPDFGGRRHRRHRPTGTSRSYRPTGATWTDRHSRLSGSRRTDGDALQPSGSDVHEHATVNRRLPKWHRRDWRRLYG